MRAHPFFFLLVLTGMILTGCGQPQNPPKAKTQPEPKDVVQKPKPPPDTPKSPPESDSALAAKITGLESQLDELKKRLAQSIPLKPGQTTSFGAVAKQLDAGGTFYLYLSTEQVLSWVDRGFAAVDRLLTDKSLGLGPVEQSQGKLALTIVKEGFLASGLRAIDGFGASTIDLPGGLKRNVSFIHRPADKGQGLIWQLFGTQPHDLDALTLAPADTVWAVHMDFDVAKGWAWLKAFITQHAPPPVPQQMNAALAQANEKFELDKLIAALGGQWGGILTLDESAKIPIPLPAASVITAPPTVIESAPVPDKPEPSKDAPPKPDPNPKKTTPSPEAKPPAIQPVALQPAAPAMIQIPEPGFALAIKVNDTVMKDKLLGLLAAQKIPVQEQEAEGVKLSVIAVPLPPDVPPPLAAVLTPTIFQSGGYLVVASSTKLAKKIIAVQQGKAEGLRGTEEFKKLSQGLELKGNQFAFLSGKFGNYYGQFLEKMMDMNSQDQMPAVVKRWFVKFATIGMSSQLQIGLAQPDGYLHLHHTTGMGQETALIVVAAAIPVAVGTALLLPALAKAKEAAKATQVANNAKQLGLAVVQAAFDANDQLPAANKWCDAVLEKAGGTQTFISPRDEAAAVQKAEGKKVSSFAFNKELDGKKLSTVAVGTVMLFECNMGWNGAGGLKELQDRDDLPERIAVTFVDGSVRMVGSSELEKLRWKP